MQTGETVFNETWARILGYTLDELGPVNIKTWRSFTHPDDWKKSKELLQRHFSGELSYYDIDCRMRHRNGNWIWIRNRGKVITRAPDGKPILMFGTQSDITELKNTLDLLLKIANRVPGLIYQFRLRPDGSSCFPFASEALSSIYHLQPEEVRNDASKVFTNLHPEDYDGVVLSIQASAKNLTPWKHEYRVKFEDGTIRWLFGDALPEKEPDGSILWHGFITDITDRK